jgi:hypothetical protein
VFEEYGKVLFGGHNGELVIVALRGLYESVKIIMSRHQSHRWERISED